MLQKQFPLKLLPGCEVPLLTTVLEPVAGLPSEVSSSKAPAKL